MQKTQPGAKKNEQKCRQFIAGCHLLGVHELVAEEYARTRMKLKNKVKPIPENDILIAAACIVNNIPLATLDSDFNHINDLILISCAVS